MRVQTICGFVSYDGDMGLKMASVELSRNGALVVRIMK